MFTVSFAAYKDQIGSGTVKRRFFYFLLVSIPVRLAYEKFLHTLGNNGFGQFFCGQRHKYLLKTMLLKTMLFLCLNIQIIIVNQ